MTKASPTTIRHVLFLDGDCLFCQKSAHFIHQVDQHDHLYFAPLQGETAKSLPDSWKILIDDKNRPTGAAVFTEAWQTEKETHWRGADAIIRALYLAGGIFKIVWPLAWLPNWIKTPAYQLIARFRYRLPITKACTIPNEEIRKYFLP